jgi:hypothetical protein
MNLTEKHCLRLILSDRLRLSESRVVAYYWGRWNLKIAANNDGRNRYQFAMRKRRGYVYANRLVWMLVHRQEIPEGYVVDHKDGNSNNDHPDNLQLMPTRNSHAQGASVANDNALGKLGRWFEFLGMHRREPATLAEVGWVEVGF